MEEPLECRARPVVSMAEMQQRGGEFAIVPAGSALSEAFYYMQAAAAAVGERAAAAERTAAAERAAERAAAVERERADRLERASAAERSEFRFMVGAAATLTCAAAAVVGVAAVVAQAQR